MPVVTPPSSAASTIMDKVSRPSIDSTPTAPNTSILTTSSDTMIDRCDTRSARTPPARVETTMPTAETPEAHAT